MDRDEQRRTASQIGRSDAKPLLYLRSSDQIFCFSGTTWYFSVRQWVKVSEPIANSPHSPLRTEGEVFSTATGCCQSAPVAIRTSRIFSWTTTARYFSDVVFTSQRANAVHSGCGQFPCEYECEVRSRAPQHQLLQIKFINRS